MLKRLLCLAAGLCLAFPALAQDAKTEAQLDAEATRANELYNQAQSLTTLPMYEELHARRPNNPAYTERLAMAYIAKASATDVPADSVAARNHARELFLEAQKQGDNSDLLQVMLEKLGAAEAVPAKGAVAATGANNPRATGGAFAQAEILFSKGDLKGAAALYQKAWEQFPNFYPAPLYAGDSEYKLNHYDEAGVWFARAIAIDPDYETAHRYWADSLMKAGKPMEAKKQYIEAFIGDPYSKAPRTQLREWADADRMRFIPPAITLPAGPAIGKDGKTQITLDASASRGASAIALAYSMNATLWQWQKFKKEFPEEKTYRRSLKEELEGLKVMLEVIHGQKTNDPTSRSLLMLENDGMLECWILLDNPDNGTAQDYVKFRATHKDLLRAYVEKYDLHPA